MKQRTARVVLCSIVVAALLMAGAAWTDESAATTQKKPASEQAPATPVTPQVPSNTSPLLSGPSQQPAASGQAQTIPVIPQLPSSPGPIIPLPPQQPAPQYYYAPPVQQYYAPVAPPVAPQYSGQWVWDAAAQTWVWQVIVPPPTYYYWSPSPYPYWGWPPGRYTFTPNPAFPNSINGMFWATPQQPPMAFKPGEGPQFPWLPRQPATAPTRTEENPSSARETAPGK
jgi:hypothetical protein